MNDSVNFPPIPGYVSVKEAAEMLGLSPRTVYDYIEEGRLHGARFADVIAISTEEIRKFKREPSGRPRLQVPLSRPVGPYGQGQHGQHRGIRRRSPLA